jgi:hypothetical protein
LSNDSTATRKTLNPAGARGADNQIETSIPSFHLGLPTTVTPGCIPSAGTIGTVIAASGRDKPLSALGSEHQLPMNGGAAAKLHWSSVRR